MNLFKTGLLMSLMMGLFLVAGALGGGAAAWLMAFLFAAGLQPVRLLEFRQSPAVDVWRARRR